jgi:glucosamine--fructose-6-phosphate aminotransferase (isomerizing)
MDIYELNICKLQERIKEKEGNAFFKEIKKEFNLSRIKHVILIGDGNSWNACLIARYMIEEYTRLKTNIIHISNFDAHRLFYEKNTLIIICGINQFRIELKEALRKAKTDGILTISISDRAEDKTDIFINTNLIIESGSTANNLIIPQLIILSLITLNIGRYKTISLIEGREIIANLYSLPSKIDFILKQKSVFDELSEILNNSINIGFLGNRYNYAIAKEGASLFSAKFGIHSSVTYASEIKHGPITLVDEGMIFIVILCEDQLLPKTISNIQELKARRARIVLITSVIDDYLYNIVDYLIKIPNGAEIYTPILSFKALQFLAYYTQNKREKLKTKK